MYSDKLQWKIKKLKLKLPDGLYGLLVGVLIGRSGCSSPSSKLDFMWYFLDGVLGDVELALDSFGEDAMEQVEETEDLSENTESELHPPPGAFKTLLRKEMFFILLRNFGWIKFKI